MRDEEYHRLIISKRAAVKTVTDIADAILPYGSCELSSWGLYNNKIFKPGRSDDGAYHLIWEVKRYKRDAEKYYALRDLLKERQVP